MNNKISYLFILLNSVYNITAGAKELLQSISEKQGKKMNTTESAKDIPAFLKFFKARIKNSTQNKSCLTTYFMIILC